MVRKIRKRDTKPVGEDRAGLRAATSGPWLVKEIGLLLASAAGLSLLGAFGVLAEASWHERFAYWLRTTFIGYVLFRTAIWVGALYAHRLDMPEWVGWLGGALLAATPMSLWLWWLGPVVNLGRQAPSFSDFIQTYGQVVVPAGIVLAVLWLLKAPADSGRTVAAETDAERSSSPNLMRRIPAALQTELLAISVEDHYVRVFTRNGNTLLLMRFADAISEAEGVEGMQVHRSWWVARSAIERFEQRGRVGELILFGGVVAPVARRRLAELRARGWV